MLRGQLNNNTQPIGQQRDFERENDEMRRRINELEGLVSRASADRDRLRSSLTAPNAPVVDTVYNSSELGPLQN